MYIKFKKEHPVGIDKDQCCKVDHTTALEFIEGDYAEEIKEEEYNEWKKEFDSSLRAKDAEEIQSALRATPPTEDKETGQMVKTKKKIYHTLTKADIEVNGALAKGFKPGDKVLVDTKTGLLADDDGSLVRKGN